MRKRLIIAIPILSLLSSCGSDSGLADAYGNFEAEEITVSSKVNGEIMAFNIQEGSQIEKGQIVGWIDTSDLHLQRLEIEANMDLINSQYTSLSAQIEVLKSNRSIIENEIERTSKLLESKAATSKQLDDLNGQLLVLNKQIASIESQRPNVAAQLSVAKAKLAQIDEYCAKSIITNPLNGTVLSKLARQHELAKPGIPLYSIADLSVIEFRAFISGNQLTNLKLDDRVAVKVDDISGDLREFEGRVKWISSEAEFTPKIIQTKEERVEMVYAVKVDVINDGSLKIGMPGELFFSIQRDAESQ